MRNRLTGLARASSLLALCSAAFLIAPAASADQVWHQSVGRAGSEAECQGSSSTDVEAGWTQWTASWEQWANNGTGGWTCTRSIIWAKDSSAPSVTYSLGDIGPGGGLVFLIDHGIRYEMAPNTWMSGDYALGVSWCGSSTVNVPLASAVDVGTGSANTAAMFASQACASLPAASALAYAGTDGSAGQWFMPSMDELNAMCNYSRRPSNPAPSSVYCANSQDSDFAASEFGFANGIYWSSTQSDVNGASSRDMFDGQFNYGYKLAYLHVRPIRAF